MVTITIEIPDSIYEALQAHCGDVNRFALEALAMGCYRDGLLTQEQVGEMLALDVPQTEAFLAERRI